MDAQIKSLETRECPEAFDSLFPIPCSRLAGRLPKTDGTSLTAPHALTAVQSARYVTRISPPAPRVHRPSSGNGFLRRRRVLVELRSSVGTRQKPIRTGALLIARCPHNVRSQPPSPRLLLAIPVPPSSNSVEYRLHPTVLRSVRRLDAPPNAIVTHIESVEPFEP